MKLDLRETGDGVVFPVRVSAGSRVSGIRGLLDGALKVSVTVAPEKGRANQAVIRLLADRLAIPKSSLQIVSGTTSTRKQVSVTGLSRSGLRNRLEKLL